MTERLIRLFRIIALIQGKPGIKAKELAERCETTERTIYRDLELLSTVVPIQSQGHGKGYAFMGDFSLYPLDFTDQEALAFSVLPSLKDKLAPLLPPGFDTACEKVLAAHRKEAAGKHSLVRDVADMIQMGTPAYRNDGNRFLCEIIEAILRRHTIRAVYHTQSRNEATEREIDPYCLVPRDHRYYLIGFCHNAGEVRTFRVSRFLHVEELDKIFDRSSFNIEQYMKHTWSIERGDELIRFKVRFSPNVARYVKEEEMFVRPHMRTEADGSLLFEVTLNHDREFLGWLAQYGADAEILEPVSYRQHMREQLSRWLAIYSD